MMMTYWHWVLGWGTALVVVIGGAVQDRVVAAEMPPLPGFEDVTDKVGLTGMSGGKAAWVDFNQDGWVDVYVDGVLWRNREGREFIRVKEFPEIRGGGVWGDFNNSGFPDLYCYRGHRLFRNVEGQEFVDVSHKLPPDSATTSRGAVWGDFNGNGWLDLYIAGYENWQEQTTFPNVILINQEGQGFVMVSRETRYRARGVTGCDFNMNNHLDLYVSNYRLQPNQLLVNDGTGRFQDMAKVFGVAGDNHRGYRGHTIGSAWGDFDNSGYFDLFVGNFSHPPAFQDRPKFLRNLGPEHDYKFRDMSEAAGLHWQESYASPALADFDNDGWLDLFFTTVYAGDQSVLYRNLGAWRFEDVTEAAGVATARTYQAAWADYNNNGNLDLVSGGRLFRNPGFGNHWLQVRLIGGGRVNRSAIGSQARIRLGDQVLTRQVEGATGEGNQNDFVLHFGLGQHQGPLELEIRWTDGTVARHPVAQVNRRMEVVFQECRRNPPPE